MALMNSSTTHLGSGEGSKSLWVLGELVTYKVTAEQTGGGIRRSTKIAEEVAYNFRWLERDGGWHEAEEQIERLRGNRTQNTEMETANFIDDNLKGFGPKQSRNLLQELGITRYEVPIDSRITRWLNDFRFPVTLSAVALSDRNYYRFVSEGKRELCDACAVYPCLLDAAIFSSYDKDATFRLSS